MKKFKYCLMDRACTIVRSFETRVAAEKFKTAAGRLDWSIIYTDRY